MQSISSVYRLRPGTRVLENDVDLVLRAGIIHRHDITIDKQQSDAGLSTRFTVWRAARTSHLPTMSSTTSSSL